MKEDTPLMSIVIVTWNCKAYASECLTSLRNQQLTHSTEVIVVDNASRDGTPDVIAVEFPHVRLIRSTQNLGFAKANNVGIRVAEGKYVCLINPDVVVAPNCLKTLIDYMEREPAVGLLGPKMLAPDGKVARSTMRFPSVWNSLCRAFALDLVFRRSPMFGGFLMRDFAHDAIEDVDVLNGWFWLARRAAMDKVGLLDETLFMYGDDLDWCRRFHRAGWRVIFHPDAEALHYGGGTTASAPIPFYIALQQANLQYWRKYHSRVAAGFYFLVTCLHHVVRIVGHSVVYPFRDSARRDAAFKVRRSVAALLWLTHVGANRLDQIR